MPSEERFRSSVPRLASACSAGLDQGCSGGLLRTTSQKAAASTTPGAAITSNELLQGRANTPMSSVATTTGAQAAPIRPSAATTPWTEVRTASGNQLRVTLFKTG